MGNREGQLSVTPENLKEKRKGYRRTLSRLKRPLRGVEGEKVGIQD